MVLKCKMMVQPGQFGMVRRKTFPLIKKLFEENGIEFAFPTVKVAEGDHGNHDATLAAAQEALTIEANKKVAAE
jgi:small-conductance mechanosensitive channel